MKTKPGKVFHHPLIIRITHWLNFIALGVMVSSGLRIFNASPLFNFKFPHWATLGGWLGGARLWHFAAMWFFAFNGIIFVAYNILSRHGRETTIFRKRDISGILPMIKYYLRIEKKHPEVKKYNPLQKLAYTSVPILSIGVILSGLSMYMPVTLQWLAFIFGGYEPARWFHFIFMSLLVVFFIGHLGMVIGAGWWNFWSMITGWMRIPKEQQS
jgi:thiosulfate reductase cytochrome b subunit